jgi:hypothetical protein
MQSKGVDMTTVANKVKLPTAKRAQPHRELSAKEVAQYSADILLELRQLARNSKLETLQSLIEICYYEAFSVVNQPSISAEEMSRLDALEKGRAAVT